MKVESTLVLWVGRAIGALHLADGVANRLDRSGEQQIDCPLLPVMIERGQRAELRRVRGQGMAHITQLLHHGGARRR